jgi:hypothetical protein
MISEQMRSGRAFRARVANASMTFSRSDQLIARLDLSMGSFLKRSMKVNERPAVADRGFVESEVMFTTP